MQEMHKQKQKLFQKTAEIKTKKSEKNGQQTQMQRGEANTKNPQENLDKKLGEKRPFNLKGENAKLRKDVEYLNRKCKNLEDSNLTVRSSYANMIQDYEDKKKINSNLLRDYEDKMKVKSNILKDYEDKLKVKTNLLRDYQDKSKAQNDIILRQHAEIQRWKDSEKFFWDHISSLESRLQIAYSEIEIINTKKAVCRNNGRNMSFSGVVWSISCQIAAIQLMSVIFNAMRPK